MAMRLLTLVALAVALNGCGSSGGGSGGAGDALAYLPADAATVVFVSTDVDGEQWERFDEHILRRLVVGEGDSELSLDEYAEETFREVGPDWGDDVKPLLGKDIAIGISGDPISLLGGEGEVSFVAALETRGGNVEEVLEKADLRPQDEANGATLYGFGEAEEQLFAVEDGVLIYADDEERLRDALARRDSGDGLDEDTVQEELADLPSDSLLRGFGTLDGLEEQEELRRFANVGFFKVLETWAGAARFEQDELNAEIAVRLNEEEVEEEDLPVVSGEDSPEIVPRETEISGGNLNQSQTTVFLLRTVQAAYPNSRFVRAVDEMDEDLGISFEEEILRQFNGPSASYVSPDGRAFAARSAVRDPEALRQLLPRIAPHLPALVEGLQGLQSEGMALLFLFAPDAPAAAPMQGVKVDPPTSPDGLYRISGLTGDGPAEVHLGLIGDVFVVASDEQRAREIAAADTEPADGAQGAGVLRADLASISRRLGDFFFLFPLKGKELVASLEASTKELRARVRIELE